MRLKTSSGHNVRPPLQKEDKSSTFKKLCKLTKDLTESIIFTTLETIYIIQISEINSGVVTYTTVFNVTRRPLMDVIYFNVKTEATTAGTVYFIYDIWSDFVNYVN